MPDLREVIFSITNKCNLRCKMCDIPYGSVAELTAEQWKKVIRDASRLGAQTIVFSGGEPLLRQDIYELISFSRKNNLNACITSNGCLIDEQAASKLKGAGVNVVNISIEGKKETHDFLRGAGTFDKAIAALKNLKRYKIESTVASTVSKYNYKDMLYSLEVAKEYGATTVRLQPFNSIFLKDDSRKGEFLIDKDEVGRLSRMIDEFIRTAAEYGIAVNPADYLLKIPEYLNGKDFYPAVCGALWYSCPINPNGDLLPCWIEGTNDRLIGNVAKEGLYELWLSRKRAKMIKGIINNGCKGCLMSCYDEAFTRKQLKEVLSGNARKIKKIASYRKITGRLLQLLRSQRTRLKSRFRFYGSYGGSFPAVLRRRLRAFFGSSRHPKRDGRADKTGFLDEIKEAKRRLEKEIRSI
ncbi:MAG: radical SAM protein [Candidatus Omnitrophica bacterium]|nr:radical SAM protein [Candidatus Omnitrophota bacterium]MDD5771409.1 radical SAM protein [Candidatus Omnitrophota bacterium]